MHYRTSRPSPTCLWSCERKRNDILKSRQINVKHSDGRIKHAWHAQKYNRALKPILRCARGWQTVADSLNYGISWYAWYRRWMGEKQLATGASRLWHMHVYDLWLGDETWNNFARVTAIYQTRWRHIAVYHYHVRDFSFHRAGSALFMIHRSGNVCFPMLHWLCRLLFTVTFCSLYRVAQKVIHYQMIKKSC